VLVFKFPASGLTTTSSCGPTRGAANEFLYYSEDGSSRSIPMDYRGGNGMIWGQYEGFQNGVLSLFGFFVGSEKQYRKYQNRAARPGPIPTEQPDALQQ
jgi:hypothetical protein